MALVAGCVVPHPPIIIPAIGRGEESRIARTKDALVSVAATLKSLDVETIVVISPHKHGDGDAFRFLRSDEGKGDFGRFGHPEIRASFQIDTDMTDAIMEEANKSGIRTVTDDVPIDHGVLVPMAFLGPYVPDASLVVIALSGLSGEMHASLGGAIRKAADASGKRVAIIASGDLSHKLKETGPYGYVPESEIFDNAVTKALSTGRLNALMTIDHGLVIKAAQCGLDSFRVLAGAFEDTAFDHRLLSYEGPFGVGYAVAEFVRKDVKTDVT
jgi:MEMO1 family protein